MCVGVYERRTYVRRVVDKERRRKKQQRGEGTASNVGSLPCFYPSIVRPLFTLEPRKSSYLPERRNVIADIASYEEHAVVIFWTWPVNGKLGVFSLARRSTVRDDPLQVLLIVSMNVRDTVHTHRRISEKWSDGLWSCLVWSNPVCAS